MSRGLGTLERAIFACIEKCRRPVYHADLYAQMGQEPPPSVVQVSAWNICLQLNPPPSDYLDWNRNWKRPTESQLKAAKRAMNTFVRKFPEYGLMAPKGGRGKLTLYERGDKLSAMWAKLDSQTGSHVTLADAKAALVHADARRNEPFALKGKRFIEYRGLSHGLTVKGKRVFKDITMPE